MPASTPPQGRGILETQFRKLLDLRLFPPAAEDKGEEGWKGEERVEEKGCANNGVDGATSVIKVESRCGKIKSSGFLLECQGNHRRRHRCHLHRPSLPSCGHWHAGVRACPVATSTFGPAELAGIVNVADVAEHERGISKERERERVYYKTATKRENSDKFSSSHSTKKVMMGV